MTDEDGDGVWSATVSLEDGDYLYKFTLGDWGTQEFWHCEKDCLSWDGSYWNRALTVAGADQDLASHHWNQCAGEDPAESITYTFELNATAIDVGPEGIYAGGGVLGDARAVALSDEDGDGIWTGSAVVAPNNIGGAFVFLNSPTAGDSWGTKEQLGGQDCAFGEFNDRLLPCASEDTTVTACFGDCSGESCVATVDPDCSFDVLMADAGGYPGEITWTITNAAGETVLSGAGTDTDTQVLEMSYGETYTLNMADSWGDGWNGGILSVGGTEYTVTADEGDAATASIVCEDPTPPTCEHTFVMNDAYGDGWNGNTVDLSVGGVVIAEAITAADAGGAGTPSTEAYAFSAEEGSSITLSNWTEGSWTSEVSWSILDGTGVELASGLFGDVADVVANCTPAACPAPQVTAWSMTDTGVEFDGTNQESILSYTVEYSEEMFTPGDGTAMTYSFDSFPASLDGLTPATTYYFAMVANCAEGLTSDYIGGPDEWTTNVAAPDNDLCENAIPLVDGEAVAGTTNGATDDGERPSGDVWYSYTATNADEVTITTCGSALDTVLYVYDACDGELVTSNDDDSACDSSGLNSTVTFANDGVTTYYVMIEAYSGSGDFTVSVESTLGVEDNQIDDLRIYPNPVSDNYVTIVTSLSGDKFVELFDVNGRKVLETTINGNTLDVSSINSGFYMLKVTMNGQSNVSKLIVR